MDSGHVFHKLWVIESLPIGDLKTGTQLEEQLRTSNIITHPYFELELLQPNTKNDVVDSLVKIRDEVRKKKSYPMIHFECHGDKYGLEAANKELVLWAEIKNILAEINQECKMNLVVVVAACDGIYLMYVNIEQDRAPFWAIIGPVGEVKSGDVQRDFSAFYSKFFENMDGSAALYELNRGITGSTQKYHFVSAEQLFILAYKNYYKTYCIGKAKHERVENLVTEVMKQPAVKKRGVTWARKYVKDNLRDKEKHFDYIKTRFFFIDLFAENKTRFHFQYKNVIKKL